jgi:hypothetical protein
MVVDHEHGDGRGVHDIAHATGGGGGH